MLYASKPCSLECSAARVKTIVKFCLIWLRLKHETSEEALDIQTPYDTHGPYWSDGMMVNPLIEVFSAIESGVQQQKTVLVARQVWLIVSHCQNLKHEVYAIVVSEVERLGPFSQSTY